MVQVASSNTEQVFKLIKKQTTEKNGKIQYGVRTKADKNEIGGDDDANLQWTRYTENSTMARDSLPLGKEMAECYGNIDSHPKDTSEKSKYLLKYTHRRDWDANKKAECRGISYTFDGLLKYLDIDDRTQNVTVIAIQRKRKESKRGLFSRDFWAVFDIISSVINSIPIVGGVVGTALETMKDFLPLVQPTIGFVDTVKNISNGKFNISAFTQSLGQAVQITTFLAPDLVKGITKDLNTELKKYQGLANELNNNIQAFINKNEKVAERLFGNYLGNIFEYVVKDGWNGNQTLGLLKEKAGIVEAELTTLYKNFTGTANTAIVPINHPSRKIADLNEALKYFKNTSNLILSNAIGTFFNSGDAITNKLRNWSIDTATMGGNFMQVPIIRTALMKSAIGGVTGALPSIDTIIGSALGANGGQGLNYALQKYNPEGLFGIVKASIGMPTSTGELTEMLKDAFRVEANVGNTLEEQQAIVLPDYMNGEIKECIACHFENIKVPVQRCEEGQTYNYLTGKCVKELYNGFTPTDCYDPCENKTTYNGTLPNGIIECEGSYYYDTYRCSTTNNENILINVPLLNNNPSDILTAGLGTLAMTAITGLLDGQAVETAKNMCDCVANATPLEQLVICEAWKHSNIIADCENGDVSEVSQIWKSLQASARAKGFNIGFDDINCKLSGQKEWCAIFVGYLLVRAYENAGLDTSKLSKALDLFYGNVNDMVNYLNNNDITKPCNEPRPGSIFHRASYTSGNHTGIVICVDSGNKFWTIEGNAQRKHGNRGVAVGTVLMGIFVFKEPATFWRLFFISTLIISIAGLKFVSH